jgi:hypothetical protein
MEEMANRKNTPLSFRIISVDENQYGPSALATVSKVASIVSTTLQ